jgi:F-type H+-transporting ATPase subunit b
MTDKRSRRKSLNQTHPSQSNRFMSPVRSAVAIVLCSLLSCGLFVSGPTLAADGHHAGHGEHGHLPEIGHNPPAGTTQKDFESPAWFQTDLAVWSFVVFLGLLGLLTKFAWKPIMDGLDKREQGIADTIAATHAANDEAKRMLASYERRLAEASDEVRGMLEEARRDADATRQAIVAEARKAAEDEKARARHEIGLAKDEALAQIADRAGDLAVEVAGKFLREKLGRDEQSRLVRDSIASLGTKPSVN